ITQDGSPCGFAINPSSASFVAAGGTGNVNVTAATGCGWSAVSNDSWITVTSGSSGSGNGTVNYSVAANPNAAPRTGTVTIAGLPFTVNQAAGITCIFSISPSNASFGFSGGTGSSDVTATAGCGWMATSNDGWITITSGSSGSGNGTVNYSVGANPNPTPRSGTMTIAGKAFTVDQAAAPPLCTFSVSPMSASFGAGGGSGSAMVTAPAGCGWTSVSNDAWIVITAGSNGSGNGTVNYSVGVNPAATPRSGTMTIAGQTFTVNQAAASGCGFSISPTSKAFTSKGGTGTVAVAANSTCSWTAVSNVGWITVTGGLKGTGNGTVSYSVAINSSGVPRTGTMTIAGLTFTVSE
ncbi:MAG TPA: BACON domain-containing carbohydrate-binding protein, partial [Blastocatellia bacterium]|nr:BACON domain-containing carbohydrate-binding protein [Blastocatellia bacterium]